MKKAITMLIVPAFALGACSKSPDQIGVPTNDQSVYSQDGSYSQSKLYDTYNTAKSNGYNGSFEDWESLVKLHETNPEQATEQAQSSGFSGSSALIGAVAGAGATALAMQAMNNNSNRANSNYSNSRPSNSYTNNTTSRSTASVSRGGFGGAVSSGG